MFPGSRCGESREEEALAAVHPGWVAAHRDVVAHLQPHPQLHLRPGGGGGVRGRGALMGGCDTEPVQLVTNTF